MTRPVGLLLAGGRSRRMGRDKAQLVLGGMSMLDRAAAILHEAGCAEVLISGPGGLADRFAHGGPLAGLDAAVHGCSDGTVLLVVPVDMPKLEANMLAKLPSLLASHVGVCFAGQPLPFCVRVSKGLREYVQSVLEKDEADRSLMAMFRRFDFSQIAAGGPRETFANCNTPDEFSAMEENW